MLNFQEAKMITINRHDIWRKIGLSLLWCTLILYTGFVRADVTVTHRTVDNDVYDIKVNQLYYSATTQTNCKNCSQKYDALNYIYTSGDVSIASGRTAKFRAPIIRLKPGFRARTGSIFRATAVPEIDVHFIDMTAGNISNVSTVGFNEIDVLNHHFVDENNNRLVRFHYAGSIPWAGAMKDTSLGKCVVKVQANGAVVPRTNTSCDLTAEFLKADFAAYRDDQAVNVVLYVNTDNNNSSASNGRENNPPSIMMNYNRIDGNFGTDTNANGIHDDDPGRSGVEEHEMGHVFGTHHTWRQNPGNVGNPWYNIMMSDGLMTNKTYPQWDQSSSRNCTFDKESTTSSVCQYKYCDFDNSTTLPICSDYGPDRDSDGKGGLDGFLLAPNTGSETMGGVTYQHFQSNYGGHMNYADDSSDRYSQVELILNFAEYYAQTL
jgi:hypothetical protein